MSSTPTQGIGGEAARSESKQGGARGLGRALQGRAARSAEVRKCGTRRDHLPLLSQRCETTCTDADFRRVGGEKALSAACRRHRQADSVGCTDKANGAAGFSVGWHSAPPIPMPATPVLTDTLLITFRSCAAPLQSGCVARMLNILDLDAYCIPGVHDSSCVIPERSWLANAP
jgi:hypothetical protein